MITNKHNKRMTCSYIVTNVWQSRVLWYLSFSLCVQIEFSSWRQTGFDFKSFEHQLVLKMTCAIIKQEPLTTHNAMWGLTAEPVYSKKVLLMDFSDGRVEFAELKWMYHGTGLQLVISCFIL